MKAVPAQGLNEQQFHATVRAVFGIPTFDDASLGVSIAELESAKIMSKRDDRWFACEEVPEALYLNEAERLELHENQRLADLAERDRRREEARREEERFTARQRDDIEYAGLTRHIARYLSETGIAPDAQPVAPPVTPAVAAVHFAGPKPDPRAVN
jgi:hypothetical protein